MRLLLVYLPLLISLSTFADSGETNVIVRLVSASIKDTPANKVFECCITVDNRTGRPLTTTNLFLRPPGLALTVHDFYGKELARAYARPFSSSNLTFLPGSIHTYRLSYETKPTFGASGGYLRIEGALCGSSYAGSITSNIVDWNINKY